MDTVLKEILPFEEWKSKLISESAHSHGNHDVCYWNVEGRTMIVEDVFWPHFGLVMASAMCPEKYNADPKIHYTMTYVDSNGEYCLMHDEDTYKATGKTVTEEIEGLDKVLCYYYTAVVSFTDWDSACKFAYELYCRRRKFGLEVDE
jgi:hypothetical protein